MSSVSGISSNPSNVSQKQSSPARVIKPQSEEKLVERDAKKEQHFVVGKNLGVAFQNGKRQSIEDMLKET